MNKTAIILFNLGGPDCKAAIKPFLFNFFMDKNIIRLPYIFRFLLAKFIAVKRSRNEANTGYAALGYKSPLLENTIDQANALEKCLSIPSETEFKVFPCMRYWHPMAQEVVRDVKAFDPDFVVLLPLYPQYSTTTSRSSFEAWNAAAKCGGLDLPFSEIEAYPTQEGFIQASAQNIRGAYDTLLKEGHKNPRILLSAHGLPESIIKAGDPYQSHCEASAKAIIKATGIKEPDWVLCYQSRVGPQKWIGPDIVDEIDRAGKDQKAILVYPLAFVNEHIETLVEIEIEYRVLAKEKNVPAFKRVETVGTHPFFIEGLADLVREAMKQEKKSIIA